MLYFFLFENHFLNQYEIQFKLFKKWSWAMCNSLKINFKRQSFYFNEFGTYRSFRTKLFWNFKMILLLIRELLNLIWCSLIVQEAWIVLFENFCSV
jgi:hypothetical protein